MDSWHIPPSTLHSMISVNLSSAEWNNSEGGTLVVWAFSLTVWHLFAEPLNKLLVLNSLFEVMQNIPGFIKQESSGLVSQLNQVVVQNRLPNPIMQHSTMCKEKLIRASCMTTPNALLGSPLARRKIPKLL